MSAYANEVLHDVGLADLQCRAHYVAQNSISAITEAKDLIAVFVLAAAPRRSASTN